MSSDYFFVMAKPDAVERNLIGKIIARFEKRGFRLFHIRMIEPRFADTVKKHYAEHEGKTFYDGLINFTLSGKVCIMIWYGNIQVARSLIGATLPWNAEPGTIRGDYASSLPNNLVHCSDSQENAQREVNLWLPVFHGQNL